MPLFSGRNKKRKITKTVPNQQPTPVPTYPQSPPPYTAYPAPSIPHPPIVSYPQHEPPPNFRPAFSLPPLSPPPQNVYPAQIPPYGQQNWVSCVNLPMNNQNPLMYQNTGQFNRGTDFRDTIDDKFSEVISLIDEGALNGEESDLIINLPQSPPQPNAQLAIRGGEADRALVRFDTHKPPKKSSSADKSVNVFSKLDLYINSRLPTTLPPLRLYLPTYPLLCLAARYSADAYLSPQSSGERKDFVSADGRLGTKAMVVKSVPCDDKKTIVFAIRGTSMLSVRDWGVNLSTEATSPAGFLDDPGNLCHAGFLRVAKAMIKPIASRLRTLLQENPSRSSCSLIITGHSAGGAVAALLYTHMLSSTVHSELTVMTDCFKRVHCITFGSPPVSLLPLQKPATADNRLRKCLFHSFMNEGDPVVRAERAYIRSLIDLLASPGPSPPPKQLQRPLRPTPNPNSTNKLTALGALGMSLSRLDLSTSLKQPKPSKSHQNLRPQHTSNSYQPPPPQTHPYPPYQPNTQRPLWWDVPPTILSNAGRLVVLRVPPGMKQRTRDGADQVQAYIVSDEQLRQVVFGDPLMHPMELYRRRIEGLATRAVTGRLDV